MKLQDVKKIAICGAGTMGASFAHLYATAGYEVVLYDISKEQLERAMTLVAANLDRKIEDVEKKNEVKNKIATTDNIETALKDVDYIVECIIEKKDIKREFYKKIDELCKEEVIIASNTSYLNIFELMPENRLARTLIAHWFSPPDLIPLVEVVKNPDLREDALNVTLELLKSLGKVPSVLNKFVTGFCINRFQRIIGREMFYMLDNDIMSVEDMDLAVKNSLIPRAMILGFAQRYDFTGLDLSAMNLENPDFVEAPIDNRPAALFDKVAQGDLGVKSGKGFFDYSDRELSEILGTRDEKLEKVFKFLEEIGTDPV